MEGRSLGQKVRPVLGCGAGTLSSGGSEVGGAPCEEPLLLHGQC